MVPTVTAILLYRDVDCFIIVRTASVRKSFQRETESLTLSLIKTLQLNHPPYLLRPLSPAALIQRPFSNAVADFDLQTSFRHLLP